MQVKIGIISLLIKFKYKIYYSPKTANSNENTFSFIPHVCYFPCHPSIAASKSLSWTTLFSTKMRGGNTVTRTLTSLTHSIWQPSLLPFFLQKPWKNLRLSMRDTYIDRGLCIFLMQMLKAVSISFINCELVWTLYLLVCFCSGNKNTLFYASDVTHLISKGVIPMYF